MANMLPPVTRNVHSPHASFSNASGSARQIARNRRIAGFESSYMRGCAMRGWLRRRHATRQVPQWCAPGSEVVKRLIRTRTQRKRYPYSYTVSAPLVTVSTPLVSLYFAARMLGACDQVREGTAVY